MRVNIYAEEMTDRLEIIGKEIDGHTFTGLRFYLELPCTVPDAYMRRVPPGGEQVHALDAVNVRGPFMHRPGDDDSAAVTFWGKRDLRVLLRKALAELDAHYGSPSELNGVGIAATAIFCGRCDKDTPTTKDGKCPICTKYKVLPEGYSQYSHGEPKA